MERETREIMAAKAGLRPPIEPLTRCEWWRGAALYQVYVRSFRDANGDGLGDLAGVREKLDYIRSLNVDGLWLSPFNPSPQADFGYDITDLTAVDPIHGTMEDFRGLLADAHERGLKLLLDLVVLHTSEQHPWFLQSRESRDNPRADWYVWADAARDGGPPSNWLSSFGGSAWQWEPRRAQYYYHPFLREQPALDLTNPEVLEEIQRVMRFWLDEGVDGFRVDAVQCLACDPDLRDNPPAPSAGVRAAIGGGPNNPFKRQAHYFDRDVPEAFPIIHAMRQTVDAYTPERALIGELADVDSSRLSEKYTADGTGFHAVYDFDMIQASADHAALAQLVSERSAFLRTGWLTNMFSNHDSRRAVSGLTREAEAAGLRVEAAKMLIFLQFALKGGGILYQGEELGLPQPELAYEDLRDPWGRALWPDFEGRDGARTPMPWTADAPHAGFTEAAEPWLRVAEAHVPLAADAQAADPDSVLSFTRDFLAWRRHQPLLIRGGEHVHPPGEAPLLMWDRYAPTGSLTCIVNLGFEARRFDLSRFPEHRVIRAPGSATRVKDGALTPGPLGFAVLAAGGMPEGTVELPLDEAWDQRER